MTISFDGSYTWIFALYSFSSRIRPMVMGSILFLLVMEPLQTNVRFFGWEGGRPAPFSKRKQWKTVPFKRCAVFITVFHHSIDIENVLY